MKKILLIIFLILQVTAVVANARILHVGMDNRYPIGNKDISAQVYIQFLKAKATGEKYSYWHYSKYYESSFMNTDWLVGNANCIAQTTVWAAERNCYYYDYSLVSGFSHITFVIDAISSKDVQQEFEEWYADFLKDQLSDSNHFSNDSQPATSNF